MEPYLSLHASHRASTSNLLFGVGGTRVSSVWAPSSEAHSCWSFQVPAAWPEDVTMALAGNMVLLVVTAHGKVGVSSPLRPESRSQQEAMYPPCPPHYGLVSLPSGSSPTPGLLLSDKGRWCAAGVRRVTGVRALGRPHLAGACPRSQASGHRSSSSVAERTAAMASILPWFWVCVCRGCSSKSVPGFVCVPGLSGVTETRGELSPILPSLPQQCATRLVTLQTSCGGLALCTEGWDWAQL